VRLHAVRAAARAEHPALATRVADRLTDVNWRVREAASQALPALGASGSARLLEHFLSTGDRYSREQVAETLERAGAVRDLLNRYGREGRDPETRVVDRLVEMGKTSTLVALSSDGLIPEQRRRLIQRLGSNPHPHVQAFLAELRQRTEVQAPAPESWGTPL
jgi:HEAT repeat protein